MTSCEQIALSYFAPGALLVGVMIGQCLSHGVDADISWSRLVLIYVLVFLFGPFAILLLLWQAIHGGSEA